MRFRHSFGVQATPAEVTAFHRRSDALKAITPPVILMRMHSAPPELGEGDEMDFTMWLGPLPIRYVARIEQVTPDSFVDVQVRGPFQRWQHTHRFISHEGGVTEVQDEIEAEVGRGLYRTTASLIMWLGLPILFAYRGWRTRRLLER